MSTIEKLFMTMEYGPAPEDSKDALAWLEKHNRRFGHFIGGAWVTPDPAEYFDTTDPSNGNMLASIAQGSSADVDLAARFRSSRDDLLFSKPWTTASRSAKRATSISRS